MRRKVLVVGAVVVAIVLALVWKLHGGSASDDDARAGAAGRSGSASQLAGGRSRDGKRTPSAPASLSGRVTRKSDGAPIAGANVSLARAELGAMFMPADEPTKLVTTDASGAWSVPALPPGTYTVAATAIGFLPGSQDKVVAQAGEKQTVDLALVAGGTLVSGTVNDVGGGPIGGARVTMTRSDAVFENRGQLVALTGPDGKYQITLADGGYHATASHEDYTSNGRSIELSGKPLAVDFVLAPGGQIRGQVVSRDGQPVPNAVIRAASRSRMRDDTPDGLADDTGNFTLKGMPSGAIALTAYGRGFATKSPTVVELGIGEQVDGVRIVVDRAFSITGRVVEKGAPDKGVPGVQLGAFSMGSQAFAQALDPSADDGSFEIIGVQPASYMLFAVGETVVPEIGKPVEVVDHDVKDVIVEMTAGVTLAGRVEPGAVTVVSLEMPKGSIGIANMFDAVKTMMVRGHSDETGAFELRHVPPGTFSVVASAPDGRKGKLAVTVAAADQKGLVVKLEPRSSVSGRVVDANGAPVVGVNVNLRPAHDEPMEMVSFSMSGFGGGAITGADGSFREVGLDAGKYRVTVSDDQGRLAWARRDNKDEKVNLELAPGAETKDVVLTVEARDGVIRGVVVGPDKKPVADAWVTPEIDREKPDMRDAGDAIDFMRGDRQPVLTDSDGKFAITKLRRATYKLEVEGPRGASRGEKSGVKTGDSVTIVLEPLGTLSGRVTLGGSPVTSYDLTCGSDHERITSKDGTYTLERLDPGELTCNVSADTGSASGSVKIASGAAKLDFQLVPWAKLSGTIVSAISGQPIAGLVVVAGVDGGFGGSGFEDLMSGKGPTSDAAGKFTVDRVPSGKGHLAVMSKQQSFQPLASREYTVAAGQRLDLGTIKVVPPRTGEAGTLGFATTVNDGKLEVSSVKPGGPAEQAGIAVGDRVLSIDGRSIADLGIETAQLAISSGNVSVGQTVALALDRKGATVAASLVAIKW
ncbi:MAG TPA: carboxypeptidase regulatory-like domain-containing protein [Kofleriaceae bacterium]|nr:carboxypeptidase regulatory-like domain-containing protein [Kofleriaceae bacterium]